MASHQYLAFDLGASSGRAVVGSFDGERLALEEGYRFPNGMVRVLDHLHWDVLRLFEEMTHALSLCARSGQKPVSLGVDTWGVDFALIGKNRTLLGFPYAYRDPQATGVMEDVFTQVSKEDIFEQTGIQFIPINSLYHLIALVRADSPLLHAAERLLMIPDLFNLFLTGVEAAEFTDVTTTQCYNPRTGSWAWPLLDRFGIPARIMPDLIQPGTVLGPLLPDIASETGAGNLTVIAPASHDTGSAVAAVPARGQDWAYLSSGTWSLMGIESPTPVISPQALAFNVTNEGGVGGTFRVLKNIAGLWLIQECRRIWERDGDSLSHETIVQMADAAEPFTALIDPDDPAFLSPARMPDAIRDACARTGQPVPSSHGQVARCVFESLALKYRYVLDQLVALRGAPLSVLHIVGGGTQNRLLCQLTANATGLPVIAGPVEATAIGNLLVQAMARGELADLAQIREVVRRSFPLVSYEPRDRAAWNEAYGRFRMLWLK
ncbi:MAG: rhamnulokinase [Candidatus Latescibacteria bacterium]|nr:rhamnulokinase [Candidatus Latescibacterota bacterium]